MNERMKEAVQSINQNQNMVHWIYWNPQTDEIRVERSHSETNGNRMFWNPDKGGVRFTPYEDFVELLKVPRNSRMTAHDLAWLIHIRKTQE